MHSCHYRIFLSHSACKMQFCNKNTSCESGNVLLRSTNVPLRFSLQDYILALYIVNDVTFVQKDYTRWDQVSGIWVDLIYGHQGKLGFLLLVLIEFRRQFSLNPNLAEILHLLRFITPKLIGNTQSWFQFDKTEDYWPTGSSNTGLNIHCMYATYATHTISVFYCQLPYVIVVHLRTVLCTCYVFFSLLVWAAFTILSAFCYERYCNLTVCRCARIRPVWDNLRFFTDFRA